MGLMLLGLGYERPANAIQNHCRYTLKRGIPHPQSPSRQIEMSFIPESDLYRLIVRSKLPEAEQFERWVFEEVLPAIRQYGGYLTPQKIEEALLNPDVIIQLATILKNAQEQCKRLTDENEKKKGVNWLAKARYEIIVLIIRILLV